MRFNEAMKETYKLEINVGDIVLMGKFKNKKAEVEGFDFDDNNQPVIITSKGQRNLHPFRINKLMPKDKQK